MSQRNLTITTCASLDAAFDFFNSRLFGGRLPRCVISLQRHRRAFGYFRGRRFESPDGLTMIDEIALNPNRFHRGAEACLSTLVHEMTHAEQLHFGAPSRGAYHNRQWVELMRRVGLIASSTCAPGGRQTGVSVSHFIEPGGRFELACADLLSTGPAPLCLQQRGEPDGEARKKEASVRRPFECPTCTPPAWARGDAHIMCEACLKTLEANVAAGSTRHDGPS